MRQKLDGQWFKQAQTNIGQTKTLAEQAELSRLGISGEQANRRFSMHYSPALQEALPEANINAQVSQTTGKPIVSCSITVRTKAH